MRYQLSNLLDLTASIRTVTVFIVKSTNIDIFTALHGMLTKSSDENSVCLSVCLSNACIVTKRKKNHSRFLYHAKDNLA